MRLDFLSPSVLHSLDDIADRMDEYSTGVRGHVRLAANLSSITQFLPRQIKQFLAGHPQVEIQLEELISTRVTKAVADNQVDIGIFAQVPHGQDVETYRYHSDRLTVITPRDHPLAARESVSYVETLDYDFVGLHNGSAINLQLVKAATELDRTVRMRIQVTSYEALCLLVETGLGIGLLPETVANRYFGTLEIGRIRLDEPWAERELRLCVRSYAALPPAARMLFDELRPDD